MTARTMSPNSKSRRHITVIPRRWGPTRFPGKPLALLCGKPML
jgi:CMP-2-keto-3-deoxyoctulosonic acid synthetase